MIKNRPFALAERRSHRIECIDIAVVSIDVTQEADKPGSDSPVEPVQLVDGIKHMRLEGIEFPSRPGYPNEGNIKPSSFAHCVERGKNLFIREVTACAEQHQCICSCRCHLRRPGCPYAIGWDALY